MAIQQVKPKKINFLSQQSINEKNRSHRKHVLRILDQMKAAEKEVAVTSQEK